jgi:DNA-binding transcriptional regulator YiaG
MPRSKPLPQTEIEIAARLVKARMAHGLWRSDFAKWLSPAQDALKRIELGRLPLTYRMARNFWDERAMPHLNPFFLATGRGNMRLEHQLWLPRIEEIDAGAADLFSAVVARFSEDLSTLAGEPSQQRLPLSWIPAQRFMVEYKRHKLKSDIVKVDALEAWINEVDRRSVEFSKKDLPTDSAKRKVHEMAQPRNIDVPTLPELISRAKRVTSVHGEKSRLAHVLNVPPSRVTEWLKGKVEPSGAITLTLYKWVLIQEKAEQIKSPGGVITATRVKTRKRNANENKSQSSPP